MIKRVFFISALLLFINCVGNDELLKNSIIDQSYIEKLETSNNNFKLVFKDKSDNTIEIESNISNQKLLSTMFLINKNGLKFEFSKFIIDLSDSDYKTSLNKYVEKNANRLRYEVGLDKVSSIENSMELLPEILFDSLQSDFFSETAQSFFYHLSVLKAIQRAQTFNLANCDCGKLDTFVSSESPFLCSQDKMAKANEIKVFLLKNISSNIGGQIFDPEETYDFLNERNNTYVSLAKIDIIINKDFKKFWKNLPLKNKNIILNKRKSLDFDVNILNSIEPEFGFNCESYGVIFGNECGCCGNYSDFCSFCSIVCLWHDQDCSDCSPSWYCGWDCQTGCP